MFKLDGSETGWLIYADWLEDQDINAKHIRETLSQLPTRYWEVDFYTSSDEMYGVGASDIVDNNPGGTENESFDRVGTSRTLLQTNGVGAGDWFHYVGTGLHLDEVGCL